MTSIEIGIVCSAIKTVYSNSTHSGHDSLRQITFAMARAFGRLTLMASAWDTDGLPMPPAHATFDAAVRGQ